MRGLDAGSQSILDDIRELNELETLFWSVSHEESCEKIDRYKELRKKYEGVQVIKVLLNYIDTLKAQVTELESIMKIEQEAKEMNESYD